MESLKQNKILLGIFGITAVLFFGYKFFGSSLVSSVYEGGEISDQTVGQDVISLLNDLQKVNIDTDLFNSTIWKNLEDFSIVLPEDEVGNQNLFSPLNISKPVSAPKQTTRR